jgi:hypothetical protein
MISSTAFNDRHERPSVDLASLCPGEVPQSQLQNVAAVGFLLVEQVRALPVSLKLGDEPFQYALDVEPRPIAANPAHAQIESVPVYAKKTHFRKVKEALSRILESGTQWAIRPVAQDPEGAASP